MRLALAALLSLAACGGTARPATPSSASSGPAAEPAAADAEQAAPTADDSTPAELAAADSAAPAAATPTPDTPMCRSFKAIVNNAGNQFAELGATQLPGAASCTVVSGGPGQAATATYTCEFGAAATAAELVPKRDELDKALRGCGSSRAFSATRVRVVTAAGAAHLVVNVHDSARW